MTREQTAPLGVPPPTPPTALGHRQAEVSAVSTGTVGMGPPEGAFQSGFNSICEELPAKNSFLLCSTRLGHLHPSPRPCPVCTRQDPQGQAKEPPHTQPRGAAGLRCPLAPQCPAGAGEGRSAEAAAVSGITSLFRFPPAGPWARSRPGCCLAPRGGGLEAVDTQCRPTMGPRTLSLPSHRAS